METQTFLLRSHWFSSLRLHSRNQLLKIFQAFFREQRYFKTQGINPYKHIFSAKISPRT